jgi:hypothetical protein
MSNIVGMSNINVLQGPRSVLGIGAAYASAESARPLGV